MQKHGWSLSWTHYRGSWVVAKSLLPFIDYGSNLLCSAAHSSLWYFAAAIMKLQKYEDDKIKFIIMISTTYKLTLKLLNSKSMTSRNACLKIDINKVDYWLVLLQTYKFEEMYFRTPSILFYLFLWIWKIQVGLVRHDFQVTINLSTTLLWNLQKFFYQTENLSLNKHHTNWLG